MEPRRDGGGERSTLEPDYEDENPGSYLAELGTRRLSVAWGLANLAATVLVGGGAWAAGLGPGSEWHAVLRLLWLLVPASSIILLVLTFWQLGTAYTVKPPSRVIAAVVTSVISLGLWALLAFGAGVLSAG
ncbi:MAG: hypothetical protein HY721_10870 [Planctomycetes bacterium]|nr:hypothetical protein [Planctomycetota bacterium]